MKCPSLTGALDCAETQRVGPSERGMGTRARERESWGWAQVNIEHIAESWRTISGKAATGRNPSPEEGPD